MSELLHSNDSPGGIIYPNSPMRSNYNGNDNNRSEQKGFLAKRQDFVGVDKEARGHPNRKYYFRKSNDIDEIILTCSKKLEVTCIIIRIKIDKIIFSWNQIISKRLVYVVVHILRNVNITRR